MLKCSYGKRQIGVCVLICGMLYAIYFAYNSYWGGSTSFGHRLVWNKLVNRLADQRTRSATTSQHHSTTTRTRKSWTTSTKIFSTPQRTTQRRSSSKAPTSKTTTQSSTIKATKIISTLRSTTEQRSSSKAPVSTRAPLSPFRIIGRDNHSLPAEQQLKILYDNVPLTPVEIRNINMKVTKLGPYADERILKSNCSTNEGLRRNLFKLFKHWIDLSAFYNITWWFSDGSLVGALRHGDVVPWDQDSDISVPLLYEPLLRKLQIVRGDEILQPMYLVCRPGPYCVHNGMRQNCAGKITYSFEDECAFCGPLSRLYGKIVSRYIDIFRTDLQSHNGRTMVYMESHYESTNHPPLYPLDWIYPLKVCSFMGLTVLCPRQGKKQLVKQYDSFEMRRKCVGKKWS